MSASPTARQAAQSQAQFIPTKRVLVSDASQLPSDYSSTPGGTWYSTTPGGTRIVYDRSMLLHLKNSPLAQTPPKNHVVFPASMVKGSDIVVQPKVNGHVLTSPAKKDNVDESQFEMDM